VPWHHADWASVSGDELGRRGSFGSRTSDLVEAESAAFRVLREVPLGQEDPALGEATAVRTQGAQNLEERSIMARDAESRTL